LRSPSLDFALRAILRMSQFAPGELVLRAQEKVPEEKGNPHRLAPVPCIPRQAGGPRNPEPERDWPIPRRLASNRVRALLPAWLRYSAQATGSGVATHRPFRRRRASQPVRDRASRTVEPGLLAGRRCESCEFGEHPNRREAHGKGCAAALYIQGTWQPGLRGRLSFGYFSLAKQRKVPRPTGRNLSIMDRSLLTELCST